MFWKGRRYRPFSIHSWFISRQKGFLRLYKQKTRLSEARQSTIIIALADHVNEEEETVEEEVQEEMKTETKQK